MRRGTGKLISKEEKAKWHPDVWVQFNPKAWATQEYCEDWVDEMATYRRVRRGKMLGKPSLLFCDNLDAQTTPSFKDALFTKGYCFLHLLPTGCTSELQHIDSGLGSAVKMEMLKEADAWAEQDKNIERLGEGKVNMLLPTPSALVSHTHVRLSINTHAQVSMSEKRVILTNWLAAAWQRVCEKWDFTTRCCIYCSCMLPVLNCRACTYYFLAHNASCVHAGRQSLE